MSADNYKDEKDNTVPNRQELERITAPRTALKLAGDAERDPELRATWLALGGLLDRNTPVNVKVDEARVRAAISTPRETRVYWGPLVWAGVALAASVVFALWIMHGILAKDETSRPNYVRQTPDLKLPGPTTAGHRTTRPAVIEVAWDDRMTGRIAQVHTGVRQLHGPAAASANTQATRHDDRVDALRSRINNLQRAWGANKL